MSRVLVLAATILMAVPMVAGADVYTDDFEGGVNESAWAWIRGGDILEDTGGNPGWWLHQAQYDTFAPIVDTGSGIDTPFVGDYTASIVTRISADLRTDRVDFGDGEGFELALILRKTNGTPNDPNDDDYAYTLLGNIPIEGAGWTHYDVAIPSLSNEDVPAGWFGGWVGDCETFRPGVVWADVMASVDRVEFMYLNPCFSAIFQGWDVGADNLEIEFEGGSTPTAETSWGSVKNLYR